jgi:hypothetical protein
MSMIEKSDFENQTEKVTEELPLICLSENSFRN